MSQNQTLEFGPRAGTPNKGHVPCLHVTRRFEPWVPVGELGAAPLLDQSLRLRIFEQLRSPKTRNLYPVSLIQELSWRIWSAESGCWKGSASELHHQIKQWNTTQYCEQIILRDMIGNFSKTLTRKPGVGWKTSVTPERRARGDRCQFFDRAHHSAASMTVGSMKTVATNVPVD